jgi:hypothetical protein
MNKETDPQKNSAKRTRYIGTISSRAIDGLPTRADHHNNARYDTLVREGLSGFNARYPRVTNEQIANDVTSLREQLYADEGIGKLPVNHLAEVIPITGREDNQDTSSVANDSAQLG